MEMIIDMSDGATQETPDLIAITGDLVSAYVSNNPVRPTDLPDLIRSVHAALTGLVTGAPHGAEDVAPEKPSASQIRKSVTPDGIVSFLDGKTYKTLKRHLAGHGLDPQSYRQRYGLPADYPMVAPEYAARRSELAKSIGLGRAADRTDVEQPRGKQRTKAA